MILDSSVVQPSSDSGLRTCSVVKGSSESISMTLFGVGDTAGNDFLGRGFGSLALTFGNTFARYCVNVSCPEQSPLAASNDLSSLFHHLTVGLRLRGEKQVGIPSLQLVSLEIDILYSSSCSVRSSPILSSSMSKRL